MYPLLRLGNIYIPHSLFSFINHSYETNTFLMICLSIIHFLFSFSGLHCFVIIFRICYFFSHHSSLDILFLNQFLFCVFYFLPVFFTFFCISVNCIFEIFHSSPLFSTCPLLHSNDCLFFFPQTTSHYIFFRYFFFFLITASSPSSRTLMTP